MKCRFNNIVSWTAVHVPIWSQLKSKSEWDNGACAHGDYAEVRTDAMLTRGRIIFMVAAAETRPLRAPLEVAF